MTDEKIKLLVETWQAIIIGENKSWVMFENGTCVILMNSQEDLATQAIDIMKEWGPVVVATGAADFNVITLKEHPGWVITGHHPDMLNYVSPEELEEDEISDVSVGLLGRYKRDEDSQSQKVVHIEDKRNK